MHPHGIIAFEDLNKGIDKDAVTAVEPTIPLVVETNA